MMFQRLDRADRKHWQQREGHVGSAQILQHIARKGKGQALPAMRQRRGNRVPALFDIGLVSRLEPVRQAHNAIFKPRAFQIANPVERGKFPGSKLPHTLDNRLDKITFSVREFFSLREFFDPGVDTNGKQLIGGRRGVSVHG